MSRRMRLVLSGERCSPPPAQGMRVHGGGVGVWQRLLTPLGMTQLLAAPSSSLTNWWLGCRDRVPQGSTRSEAGLQLVPEGEEQTGVRRELLLLAAPSDGGRFERHSRESLRGRPLYLYLKLSFSEIHVNGRVLEKSCNKLYVSCNMRVYVPVNVKL